VLVEPGAPFCAVRRAVDRPLSLAGFDWVEVAFVRAGEGWAVLAGRGPPRLVGPGDVVVVMAGVSYRVEPFGEVVLTREFFAPEFLSGLDRWRRETGPGGRPDGRWRLLPAQTVRLGAGSWTRVWGWLDRLEELTAAGRIAASFFGALSAATGALGAVEPLMRRAGPPGPAGPGIDGARDERAALSCRRPVESLRPEVEAARVWIEAHYGERFTITEVAARAHLSEPRLRALFREGLGQTPLAYRDSLRVGEMARLLVGTELTVEAIVHRVGWVSVGRAARVFTAAVGQGPAAYRRSFRERAQG
jgi:AraC-like DNA-binding protein